MTIKKILIFGEGPTDVGIVDVYGEWEKGCIVSLIERINPYITIDFVKPPHKKDVTSTSVVPMKGKKKLEGHGLIIQKLIIYARKNKLVYDLIVYYGDTDKQSQTKNNSVQAEKASKVAYEQAFSAFETFQLDGIPVIPLRMIESWLLADSGAYERAFGKKVSALPSDPELIWGEKNDIKSNYPKNYLNRILSSINLEANRQIFIEIMENIDLNVLNRTCSISFPPFYEQAKRLLV